MIVDRHVIEHFTQRAKCHSQTVRPAETAILAPGLHVRLQIQEHARNATPAEFWIELGQHAAQFSQNRFVSAVSDFGGHKVFQRFFIHVRLPLAGFWMARALLPLGAAWVVGAFLSVDPVHVEAVAIGVGQPELRVTMLTAIAVGLYVRWRREAERMSARP